MRVGATVVRIRGRPVGTGWRPGSDVRPRSGIAIAIVVGFALPDLVVPRVAVGTIGFAEIGYRLEVWDERSSRYRDELLLIITGPVAMRDRLVAILAMNSGASNHWLPGSLERWRTRLSADEKTNPLILPTTGRVAEAEDPRCAPWRRP